MSEWTKRRPTCCITCWCSCAAENARSPTPRGCSMAVAPNAPGAHPDDASPAGSADSGSQQDDAQATAATALAVAPSLERARELTDGHSLIPIGHSFVDDCETPVSAFLKLRALAPEEPAFLLESAEQGQRVGRWSFIGVRPRAVLRWSLADGGDPYALAAEAVARYRQAPLDDLPPFAGGAVGYFGYDLVRTVEPLGEPNEDVLGLPDMALMLSDVLVVFDHLKHTVTVLAHVHVADDLPREYAQAQAAIAEVCGALAGPVPTVATRVSPRSEPVFESNMSR